MTPDPRDLLTDLLAAFGLLTRLPLPGHAARGARTAWCWPLVGLAVGGLAAAAGASALAAGFGPGVVAALVLGAQAMLTGAMHEDGLADTADGLWGGWTRERRLEIMKDSHIGSYGVLALLIVTLMRWSALTALLTAGALWAPVLVAAAVSRVPMAVIMAALPHARAGGLSRAVGRPAAGPVLLACGIVLVVSVALCGPAAALWGLCCAGVACTGLALLARARIGGQTGDILGASQQIAEAAVLAALAAMWA